VNLALDWLHLLIPLMIVERLWELRLAKANGGWLRSRGAVETGAEHYPKIVTVHVLWFIGMLFEILFLGRDISPLWPLFLALVVLAQFLRYWSVRTLGRRWSTRILVPPKSKPIVRGPYRYLRHPNYVAVIVELAALPLLYGAYVTAVAISIINALVLRTRVRMENEAIWSRNR
jgi:methyltransferase